MVQYRTQRTMQYRYKYPGTGICTTSTSTCTWNGTLDTVRASSNTLPILLLTLVLYNFSAKNKLDWRILRNAQSFAVFYNFSAKNFDIRTGTGTVPGTVAVQYMVPGTVPGTMYLYQVLYQVQVVVQVNYARHNTLPFIVKYIRRGGFPPNPPPS